MITVLEKATLRETSPTSPEEESEETSRLALNIPIDKDNWKNLPGDIQQELFWFHQFVLEEKLSRREAGTKINYDGGTVSKVLDGSYEGSWDKIAKAIRSFRKVHANRGKIQKVIFVENTISRGIFDALDYGLAVNGIVIITGESGKGKSIAVEAWRDANNHGRSVLVAAPAMGGTRRLLADIAKAVGHGSDHKNTYQIHTNILKAFNSNRMLIVDEATRLLPAGRASMPVSLELLRDLHDRTGCALALVATARFDTELRKGEYMFEQVLRRALPHRIARVVTEKDVAPILQQFIKKPGPKVLESAVVIGNSLGSLGVLGEILKVGSSLASDRKRPMCDEDFFSALAKRLKKQGETQFAKKD
jgi:DNA transposition AAA+ family ATPase